MDTRQVIAEVGLTHEQFYRLLFKGAIPKPARRIGPSYVWSAEELANVKQILAERNARKGRAGAA